MNGIAFPPVQLPAAPRQLKLEVRDFLREELASGAFEPHCDSWLSGHSPEFSRKLAARGWLGMLLPRRYGGHERTAIERFVVVEELLAAGAPVAAHWVADRQTGPLLLKYGTEAQRQRFLPQIARGECFFAIGMSEPDAGSDLSSVRTRAVPVDGGWKVNGTKVWTSHGQRSHFSVVLCRTAPLRDNRHAGLSQLLVDLSSRGVEVRPIRLLTGEEHFCQVILDDVFVPEDMVVGSVGEGWRQVTAELAFERSGPERFLSTFPLLTELVREANQRSDSRLTETIGRLVAQLAALRSLSLSIAARIDAGEAPALESALVKEMGTRFEKEVVEAARLAVAPASASLRFKTMFAEAILHSPGFTLRGGTNEILRGIVGQGLAAR